MMNTIVTVKIRKLARIIGAISRFFATLKTKISNTQKVIAPLTRQRRYSPILLSRNFMSYRPTDKLVILSKQATATGRIHHACSCIGMVNCLNCEITKNAATPSIVAISQSMIIRVLLRWFIVFWRNTFFKTNPIFF